MQVPSGDQHLRRLDVKELEGQTMVKRGFVNHAMGQQWTAIHGDKMNLVPLRRTSVGVDGATS